MESAVGGCSRDVYCVADKSQQLRAERCVHSSARTGAKELGASKNTVGKWLRELEHYGFVVKVRGAHLGSEGYGKAALYRLTDRWYAGQAPTYDCQNWSGELFEPKKQNPVPARGTPRPSQGDIRQSAKEPANEQIV